MSATSRGPKSSQSAKSKCVLTERLGEMLNFGPEFSSGSDVTNPDINERLKRLTKQIQAINLRLERLLSPG